MSDEGRSRRDISIGVFRHSFTCGSSQPMRAMSGDRESISASAGEDWFVVDSPLEEAGFELLVPLGGRTVWMLPPVHALTRLKALVPQSAGAPWGGGAGGDRGDAGRGRRGYSRKGPRRPGAILKAVPEPEGRCYAVSPAARRRPDR
jgi:hypothetical protein